MKRVKIRNMKGQLRLVFNKRLIISFLILTLQSEYCGSGIVTDSSKTMDFSYLRDTVFTLHPYFIELNLKSQTGCLYSRDGWTKPFVFSSGTDKLEDGVNTNEGLYVIQSKLPKWYSRQFDSTLMLNWMGFNFGIGFHSLKTSGYYRYLGKRKSSHGCVRISRAVAKELYKTIDIGTPVLVSNGNNAVVVAFADSTKRYLSFNYKETNKNILNRLKQIYSGRYFTVSRTDILIDKFNVHHSGLPIGNSNKILKRQAIKSMDDFVASVIPKPKSTMMIGVTIKVRNSL